MMMMLCITRITSFTRWSAILQSSLGQHGSKWLSTFSLHMWSEVSCSGLADHSLVSWHQVQASQSAVTSSGLKLTANQLIRIFHWVQFTQGYVGGLHSLCWSKVTVCGMWLASQLSVYWLVLTRAAGPSRMRQAAPRSTPVHSTPVQSSTVQYRPGCSGVTSICNIDIFTALCQFNVTK